MNFKLQTYKKFKPTDYSGYVIGADIGGTNTRIGIAGTKKGKFELLFTMTYSSSSFKSLSSVLNHAKSNAKEAFGISIRKACIAAAGPVTNNRNTCRMTNAEFTVNRRRLMAQTRISIMPLINDLEAMGESIEHLSKKDFATVQKGRTEKDGRKVVIAAGTGLGKCLILKDKENKIIVPSEFGNNDFPAYSQDELELLGFIKKKKKISSPVQYEDVISGPGIENIYDYITQTKTSKYSDIIEKSPIRSVSINNLYAKDPVSRETIREFVKYYARFAKNTAFDDLPLGGIYIGGGIACNHPEFFGKEFIKEFTTSETHQKLLKSIPIFVVTNDDAGIIGACATATRGANE